MRSLERVESSRLMPTAAEQTQPFEPLMPNAETVEAMQAARRGELVTVGSIDNLLADLHAERAV
jgi:DNA-damage-inducible protein J